MSQEETIEAGWYPNPENPTELRWWDGQAWTDQVFQGTEPPKEIKTGNSSSSVGLFFILVILFIIACLAIVFVL
jgi:hypothetical protein